MQNTQKPVCPIDLLVWVGSGPRQYQRVDQFLTEAKLRGCCRQLPSSERWMTPGKTRVFLVHRAGHKDKTKASVFGYYVLHRIEVIAETNIANKMNVDQLWPKNPGPYLALVERCRKRNLSKNAIKAALKSKLQHDHLRNVARDEVSEKSEFHLNDDLAELLKEVLKEEVEDWLRDHLFHPEHTRDGEGHRGCSTRKGPGSIYLVDALCAAIHDQYRIKLERELSNRSSNQQQEYLKGLKQGQNELWYPWFKTHRRRAWKPDELLGLYRGPFLEAVKQFKNWKSKIPLDQRLRGKAERYSELIVFKEPHPSYQNLPKASFRGFRHIDGDELINQIADHKGKERLVLNIPYLVNEESPDMKQKQQKSAGPEKIRSQVQLAALLAGKLGLTKASTSRFFSQLPVLVAEQLRLFGKFKIQGVGTIRFRGTAARRPIAFEPSEVLNRSLKIK